MVIGGCSDAAIRTLHKRVVVLGAAHMDNPKAFAKLESLDRRDTKHSLPDIRLELIKDWLTESRGRHDRRVKLQHAMTGVPDPKTGMFFASSASTACDMRGWTAETTATALQVVQSPSNFSPINCGDKF